MSNSIIFIQGKYAYIESSHRHPGDRAQLSSQLMTGTKCMQFVYNMRGIYMGAINVFQVYGQIRNVLLSLSGNHDRPWHKAVVNIPDVARLYKVNDIRTYFLSPRNANECNSNFLNAPTPFIHLMAKY